MWESSARSLLPAGYDVVRRQLEVGPLLIELLVVADPNQLAMDVAEDEFATDERLPYWAELWPSALALGRCLVKRGRRDGVKAIELGCGMGLTGVVAGLLGADVLFTDFEPDALAFAAANHALNLGPPGTTMLVDWRDPPPNLTAPLVLGADVAYERRFLEPFVSTLTRMVTPGGTALIAEPDRAVAAGVIEMIEARGFRHDLHVEEVTVGAASYPIWIHELVAPPG